MSHLRLTNVDNKEDRGSRRMRYVASGLLAMAAKRSEDHGGKIALPDLVLAGKFAVITGGHGLCELLCDRLQDALNKLSQHRLAHIMASRMR